MKKIGLIIFLILFSTNIFSQENYFKKATKITNKMAKVLSLNKEEKSKIYEIQLHRFKRIALIRQKYEDDPEIKNYEIKKVFNKLYGRLKGVLGKDKMKEWNEYKKMNN
ncbi:MAG: Uncharacterised protein [Flavobacterium sp. SCGC AAA160-P02]|nr:MAG: Uncharacterised protein [Flavobacterium sp. SCGC AAA160-P02]